MRFRLNRRRSAGRSDDRDAEADTEVPLEILPVRVQQTHTELEWIDVGPDVVDVRHRTGFIKLAAQADHRPDPPLIRVEQVEGPRLGEVRTFETDSLELVERRLVCLAGRDFDVLESDGRLPRPHDRVVVEVVRVVDEQGRVPPLIVDAVGRIVVDDEEGERQPGTYEGGAMAGGHGISASESRIRRDGVATLWPRQTKKSNKKEPLCQWFFLKLLANASSLADRKVLK